MIRNIFTLMAQKKAWQKENGLYVFSVSEFYIPDNKEKILLSEINPNITKHISLILSAIQISTHLVSDNKICLTPKEYTALYKIFKKLKAKQYFTLLEGSKSNLRYFNYLFHQPVTSLTDWYTRYNTPNENDWEFLKKHIFLKHDDTDKIDLTSENNRQHIDAFIDLLRENTIHSPIAQRIINEFIQPHQQQRLQIRIAHCIMNRNSTESSVHSLFKEPPKKLIIDTSPSAHKELEKNKFLGCYKKNKYTIQIKHDLATIIFVSVFLHELRHTTQNYYKFNTHCQSDGIVSSCQNFIRNLAIEAEAKAFENIYNLANNRVENHIYHQHETHTLDELSIQSLPIRENISSEDKLLAIIQYIDAVTTEKTIQTLCDTYLAKSRIHAMRALNKNKIILSPQYFHTLMQTIEQWKKTYFAHYRNTLVTDEKFSHHNDENESQITENLFSLLAHLKIGLKGCQIFSKEVAQNLSIYHSIFGHKSKPKSKKLKYKYRGISQNTLPYAEKLIQKEQYQNIINLYNSIQRLNPFLPPVKQNINLSDSNLAIISNQCYQALQKMAAHESPDNITCALGYDTFNYFDGKTILDVASPLLISEANMKPNELSKVIHSRVR